MQHVKRLPSWLKRKPGSASETESLKKLLRNSSLNTVCEEARCPNIAECFSRGTATFMILGDICTRGCRFCSVITGRPALPESAFLDEAKRVADAVVSLSLNYIVITSVARDDLSDGGASGFSATIREIKRAKPDVQIEVLIPDLRGNRVALQKILDEEPCVLNHNLETVPRLYRRVRPGSSYKGSLELLKFASEYDNKIKVKTGIMLGLGEIESEIDQVLRDSYEHGVRIFTAGQYMQPTRNHLPVQRYLLPEEFNRVEVLARQIGFPVVFSGPLVRSSYHAGEVHSSLNEHLANSVNI